MKIVGCLFDVHIPFQSRAYTLALEILDFIGIDELVLGGDFLDFLNLSSHGKNLKIKVGFEDELDNGKSHLRILQKTFPEAKKVFMSGNHENRMLRYLTNKCPELYNVITIPEILQLGDYDFDFVDYGPYQMYKPFNKNIIIRHEPLAGGEYCAAGTAKKGLGNILFGHTHRIDNAFVTSLDGKTYHAMGCGFLGDKHNLAFNYTKNHHNWQMGFAIIYFEGEDSFIEQVYIKDDYSCMANGHIWRG